MLARLREPGSPDEMQPVGWADAGPRPEEAQRTASIVAKCAYYNLRGIRLQYTVGTGVPQSRIIMLQIIAIVLPIVISFVLSVVIGGKIAQRRQQAGWIAQQRFSGEEKEYTELKKLSDEIASGLGTRIYSMQRLALQLSASRRRETLDEDALEDYKEAIKTWNYNLGSFYVRLSQLNLDSFRYKLESNLHRAMREQAAAIDNILHNRDDDSGRKLARAVLREMNKINGRSIEFNRSLLSRVHTLRTKIYFPKRIVFCRDTMSHFSSWVLIKAIFASDVNGISILRSPLDP